MQVKECKKLQSYKTSQVGGRASQVGVITVWFLMLGNDSLYFAMIHLTPFATRTIILGSPNDSLCFGQKRKITIHLSLFTRHYSLVLFNVTIHSEIFLFKGGCPLYSKQVFLELSSRLLP